MSYMKYLIVLTKFYYILFSYNECRTMYDHHSLCMNYTDLTCVLYRVVQKVGYIINFRVMGHCDSHYNPYHVSSKSQKFGF